MPGLSKAEPYRGVIQARRPEQPRPTGSSLASASTLREPTRGGGAQSPRALVQGGTGAASKRPGAPKRVTPPREQSNRWRGNIPGVASKPALPRDTRAPVPRRMALGVQTNHTPRWGLAQSGLRPPGFAFVSYLRRPSGEDLRQQSRLIYQRASGSRLGDKPRRTRRIMSTRPWLRNLSPARPQARWSQHDRSLESRRDDRPQRAHNKTKAIHQMQNSPPDTLPGRGAASAEGGSQAIQKPSDGGTDGRPRTSWWLEPCS